MYIYAYVYVCMYIYTHTSTRAHKYAFMYVCTFIHTYQKSKERDNNGSSRVSMFVCVLSSSLFVAGIIGKKARLLECDTYTIESVGHKFILVCMPLFLC